MSFIRRVINIPDKLKTFVFGVILYGCVQFELWLESVTGISFDGIFQPLAAIFATILAFLVKAFLEKVIPERFHGLVNNILVWLGGFLAADFFYEVLTI